jgi:hypothetical protein
MIKQSRRQREEASPLVTLVGAIWLVTIAAVAGYAEHVPLPLADSAAVYQLSHVDRTLDGALVRIAPGRPVRRANAS